MHAGGRRQGGRIEDVRPHAREAQRPTPAHRENRRDLRPPREIGTLMRFTSVLEFVQFVHKTCTKVLELNIRCYRRVKGWFSENGPTLRKVFSAQTLQGWILNH